MNIYALVHNKTGKLVGTETTSNDGRDDCCDVTFSLAIAKYGRNDPDYCARLKAEWK